MLKKAGTSKVCCVPVVGLERNVPWAGYRGQRKEYFTDQGLTLPL